MKCLQVLSMVSEVHVCPQPMKKLANMIPRSTKSIVQGFVPPRDARGVRLEAVLEVTR